MEKILLGLTVLFFTITGLFYYFFSSFNKESKRNMFFDKVAGAQVVKKNVIEATDAVSPFPTILVAPSPVPTEIPEKIMQIPLGNVSLGGQNIEVTALKTYMGEDYKQPQGKTIPFADFSLEIKFPKKISPGSGDNKFVFDNKEYEVKLFSQIGSELGFDRENFFAEKTGKEMGMLLYKINNNSIIINRETGWWEGGVQIAIVITPDGTSENVVRFFIE